MGSSSPVFYLLPMASLEPASSATSWLGRIVQNYASPGSAYTPEDPSPFVTAPLSDKTFTDVTAILKSSSSSEVKARLSSLASLSRSSTPQHELDVSSQSFRFLRLRNHDDVFKALRESPEVQRHLADSLRLGGSPAYMVVGLAIWTDAKFTKSESTAKASSADLAAPVTAALAASTGIVLPGADVEVGRRSTAMTGNQLVGVGQGSSIFAIEYRAVRRRLRSVMDSFGPSLEQYGPRTANGFVFSGGRDAVPEQKARIEQPAVLTIDEEDVGWTEILDDGPEVEEFEEFAFAFDQE